MGSKRGCLVRGQGCSGSGRWGALRDLSSHPWRAFRPASKLLYAPAVMRASTLLLVACAACGCEPILPPWSVMVDAQGASDVLVLPASSREGVATHPLAAGVTYRVVVEGTVGLWRAYHWSSVCAGTPAPAPNLPTPGATGPVGVDAEWAWSWPADSSLCRDGERDKPLPRSRRGLRMATSPLAAPAKLPPPAESGMTPNHVYTYSIAGTGMPIVFSFDDAPSRDNYGAFRIVVFPEAPPPA